MSSVPSAAIMPVVDLIAIGILVFAVYFPRHRRPDLVVAFLGVNVGVLGVTMTLAGTVGSTELGMGVGMGLFGVLSIIRLRSSEISQTEVAYYFAALAIGLTAGLSATPNPTALIVIALLVIVLALADAARFTAAYSTREILVEQAISQDAELIAHLERELGCQVVDLDVLRLDRVNDTTLVRARLRCAQPAAAPAHAAAHELVVKP